MAGFYCLIPPVVRFSGAWFLLCFGGFLYGQCPASFADFGELKVTLSAGGNVRWAIDHPRLETVADGSPRKFALEIWA
jgi:hypothetical protein